MGIVAKYVASLMSWPELVWGVRCQADFSLPAFSHVNGIFVLPMRSTNRGEPAIWARSIAPQPCIRLDLRRIPTMKQPFASATRLRGGGPILTTVVWTMFWLGSPPPRIVIGSPFWREPGWAPKPYVRLSFLGRLRCRPQYDTLRDLAEGDHAPQCDKQFTGEGDNYGRLARSLGTPGPRPIPLRERALHA